MASQPTRGRARLGVLVPFTNSNLEADLGLLCPPGVTFHAMRLGGYDIDEVPDGDQMGAMAKVDLEEALRLLAGVRPDVMLYGCTSATLTHGPEFDRQLAAQCQAQWSIPMITAASALVRSLHLLAITKVGFASPYVKSLNDDAIDFLRTEGIETVSRHDLQEDLGNYGQSEVTPEQVVEFACRADSPDAQAVVLSCTDMRAVEAVDRIEAELKKPVVTSNQAMMYWALQHTGVSSSEVQCGRLFEIDPN
ncbi:MAG: Asp/Glu racemase [Pseudomonadota bacterium]